MFRLCGFAFCLGCENLCCVQVVGVKVAGASRVRLGCKRLGYEDAEFWCRF